MGASEVDALLERLVAQFESPYDFLRELVQNAMDAGSDRVEVSLEMHEAEGDEVVFELVIMDTGEGMDEAVIDGELTRLFSTGKSGDRTMAGGFGIGFVSVFAWDPQAVLLQTGKSGEAWELVFREDRSFDKYPLDQPVEGTTLHLFRRGRAGEREAISEAVRDALWRWCRYCPLEVTFEDFVTGEAPELIQDSPEPSDEALSVHHTEADTSIRVEFGVPANAVLLRRGLILAEGSPRQLLPDIADELGRTVKHLKVWADSPLLRTTLARDKVVDDDGRVAVSKRVLKLRDKLREELLRETEELAASDQPWTPARHQRYGNFQSHLGLEYVDENGKLETPLRTRALLRAASRMRTWSLREVGEWLAGRCMLVSDPEQAQTFMPLLQAAAIAGVPVLAGDLDDDLPWVSDLARGVETVPLLVQDALSRVKSRGAEATGLCGLVEQLLQKAGLRRVKISLGEFIDVSSPDPPLFGIHAGTEASALAFYGGPELPARVCGDARLWLNRGNVLVQATMRSFTVAPLVAAMSLSAAMMGRMGQKAPEPGELADAADAVRPSS